jgi:hypothetical protein
LFWFCRFLSSNNFTTPFASMHSNNSLPY